MSVQCLYHIILADDDALCRCDLKRILEENPGLDVVGEVADGSELLNFLGRIESTPQMAIVDVSMPHLGGIAATSRIKRDYPEMKVLILTMHRETEYIREALGAGADGYLLKENADTELYPAIEKIRCGGVYISAILDEAEARIDEPHDFPTVCRQKRYPPTVSRLPWRQKKQKRGNPGANFSGFPPR